jgi:hypothetical protein
MKIPVTYFEEVRVLPQNLRQNELHNTIIPATATHICYSCPLTLKSSAYHYQREASVLFKYGLSWAAMASGTEDRSYLRYQRVHGHIGDGPLLKQPTEPVPAGIVLATRGRLDASYLATKTQRAPSSKT